MAAAMATLVALPVIPAAAPAPPAQTLHRAPLTQPTAVPGAPASPPPNGSPPARPPVRAKRALLLPGAQLVKVEPGQSVPDAITALEQRSGVRYAEPNWIYHTTSTTPNDPLFGNLWGLNNTGRAINGHAAGIADADTRRRRGTAVVAARRSRSSLSTRASPGTTRIWRRTSGAIPARSLATASTTTPMARSMTSAAGTSQTATTTPGTTTTTAPTSPARSAARGNNGIGVAGVAWQASIMPVRALDASGSGTNANIADAFTYAARNGAKVVTASLGGPGFSLAMLNAITNQPNTLFVVAAGNDSTDDDASPSYPCSYTAANLICVAASDDTDTLAGFSNYGATSVDLAAPGVDTNSTKPHYTDSFSDDFETSLGNWTVQSGPWGRVSVLGSIWLADSPSGNYADNADWAIRTTSKVDLGRAATAC
jgi:subtilase family protein/fervidolysin-like protein